MTKITINEVSHESATNLVKGEELYALANTSAETHYVVWDRGGRLDVPVSSGDWLIPMDGMAFYSCERAKVDTEENPRVRVKADFTINGEVVSPEKVLYAKYKGHDLKEMAGMVPEANNLYIDIKGNPDVEVHDEQYLVLTDGLALITQPSDNHVTFIIRVDKQDVPVSQKKMTGEEILALVGKKPEAWLLNMKLCSGERRAIEENDLVDLTQSDIERFETLPAVAQQGDGLSREIDLRTEDEQFLNFHYQGKWETRAVPPTIIVRDFELPEYYKPSKTDVLIQIPPNYPAGNFDMAFFNPPIKYENGTELSGTTNHCIHGSNWQQWSRHYTYHPEIVNVANHILFIKNTLVKEGREIQS